MPAGRGSHENFVAFAWAIVFDTLSCDTVTYDVMWCAIVWGQRQRLWQLWHSTFAEAEVLLPGIRQRCHDNTYRASPGPRGEDLVGSDCDYSIFDFWFHSFAKVVLRNVLDKLDKNSWIKFWYAKIANEHKTKITKNRGPFSLGSWFLICSPICSFGIVLRHVGFTIQVFWQGTVYQHALKRCMGWRWHDKCVYIHPRSSPNQSPSLMASNHEGSSRMSWCKHVQTLHCWRFTIRWFVGKYSCTIMTLYWMAACC